MTRHHADPTLRHDVARHLARGGARLLLVASLIVPAATFADESDNASATIVDTAFSAASTVPSRTDMVAMLAAKGYTDIDDVKFESGMWRAHARSADGEAMKVHVDAATGLLYPELLVANLSEEDVKVQLYTAGFLDVRDVDFENGVWTAEADTVRGTIEVALDPETGDILRRSEVLRPDDGSHASVLRRRFPSY